MTMEEMLSSVIELYEVIFAKMNILSQTIIFCIVKSDLDKIFKSSYS